MPHDQAFNLKDNARKSSDIGAAANHVAYSGNDIMLQAVQILSSWCTKNQCTIDEIPQYLQKVHSAILNMSSLLQPHFNQTDIDISDTIHPDYIICLEDGKKLKTLKRHLSSKYGMTLVEYKRKWGLNHNYPTVAPNYAIKRSNIAKQTSKKAKSLLQQRTAA